MLSVRFFVLGLLASILVLSAVCCNSQPGSGYSETITPGEDGFTMQMDMSVSLSPERAYALLTDFDRFPDFMPQCSSVKILSRKGNTVVVEIRRFIKFLGKNLAGKLEYRLSPAKIDVRSLNHPLADFHEEWSLEPSADPRSTRVDYTATSKMKVPMPDYMCQAWLRDNFKETLAAMERFGAQPSPAPEK